MAMEGGPYLVQAIYSFKGKNNDELCFRKGDIITITQKEEGGWWEGTLEGKTGWFPANYVQEYKQVPVSQADGLLASGKGGASPISPASPMQGVAAQRAYRHVVLTDMVESERVHVNELKTLLNTYLNPLQKTQLLTAEEYSHLIGNLPVVLDAHEQLLHGLEAELSLEERQEPGSPCRVGRLFLSSAQILKTVHTNYCAGHPRAVCLLEKYRDELGVYMESRGAAPPGLLVLTTGLSRPFRRLDKYAGMLQELERHLGEGHPDSGDTQRSVSIYGEVASGCCALRRQKELELEVLRGGIRGWEGEDLHTLGEILHMGSVAVGPDHHDRHLLLFQSTLLILSASQRMSAFIYEGKLPLSGISVTKLEDTEICKNAFEISGPMIEHIVAQCQSKEDQAKWVSLLNHHINTIRKISTMSGSGVSSPSSAPALPSSPPLPSTTTSPTSSTRSQKVSSTSLGMSNSTQAAKHVSSYKPPVPPRPFPPPKQGKSPDGTRPPRPPLPPKPTLSVNLSMMRSPPIVRLKPSHHSDPHLPGTRALSQTSDASSSSHMSNTSLSEFEFPKNVTRCPQSNASCGTSSETCLPIVSSLDALSSGDDLAKFKAHCHTDGGNLASASGVLSRSVSSLSSSELPSLLDFPDTSSNTSLCMPNDDLDSSAGEKVTRDVPLKALADSKTSMVSPPAVSENASAADLNASKEAVAVLEPVYRPPRPYSQLAAHFADLLKRHVITSRMLKELLYKEYGTVGGLETVALRVRPSEIQPCEDSEERNETEDKPVEEDVVRKAFLPRQDAIDRASEDPKASVYSGDEFVRYFEGSDVEEVYLESGDDSDSDEGSFVEVWIEDEDDGWRTIGTQTNPSYFSTYLDDLEEEEEEEYGGHLEGEENEVHGEVYGSQEIEVRDENYGDVVCRDSSCTNSDGWTYQDYHGNEEKSKVIPACSMAGLSSPLLDLREAGVSAVREAPHSSSKRFATGKKRRLAEEEKRHSIPSSLLPCLSRETGVQRVRIGSIDEADGGSRVAGSQALDYTQPAVVNRKSPHLNRGMTEGDSEGLRGDTGPGTVVDHQGATKKSIVKGKKKGKRCKKGSNIPDNEDGEVAGKGGLSRRKEKKQKELKDECVSAFLEPEYLGVESNFFPTQAGLSPRQDDGRLLHFVEDIPLQACRECSDGPVGPLRGKDGIVCGEGGLLVGERSGTDYSISCGVGVHNPGCKIAAAEGLGEVQCTCHWVDFPSRRSSDSGLADVCCAAAQGERERRKKERQQTPPSQRGDDGCHDCEERTVSASTSPLSPLVSPLPTEDGIAVDEESAPWWEKVSTPAAVGLGGQGPHPPLEAPLPRPASKGCWRLSCLRPSPPMRPCLSLGRPDTATSSAQAKRRDEQCEEGTQILRVIEAYCTGSKMRNTVNSVLLDCPQVLIAAEEKIIVEGPSGNGIIEERSLVDTVYALKEDVRDLTSRVNILGDRLDEEGRARRALAALVQAHIVTPSPLSVASTPIPFSFPLRPQEE